jgi:hypothetical protein
MFCQAGFDQRLTTIMPQLSPLSKPQATVLALWSCGMVRACSRRACSAASRRCASGCAHGSTTLPGSGGAKRQALRVETCCGPVLEWVVSGWQGTPLALALDATTLGQRFVVLAVRVV